MKKYKIIYKEVGRPTPKSTTYQGNKSEAEIVEFFGLDSDPIVEWWDIQLIN